MVPAQETTAKTTMSTSGRENLSSHSITIGLWTPALPIRLPLQYHDRLCPDWVLSTDICEPGFQRSAAD